MSLPVTTVLAGVMALLLVVLSARVIGARQTSSSSEESGGDDLATRRMRGQANFVEYVPLTLVLFAILELQNVNTTLLAILAALFAFARIIHGYAFGFTDHWRFGRLYGTAITFGVIALLGAIALVVWVLSVLS